MDSLFSGRVSSPMGVSKRLYATGADFLRLAWISSSLLCCMDALAGSRVNLSLSLPRIRSGRELARDVAKLNGIKMQAAPKLPGSKQNDVLSSSSMAMLFQEDSTSFGNIIPLIASAIMAVEQKKILEDILYNKDGSERINVLMDPLGTGTLVQNDLVYRQTFPIRSYEVGFDKMASIETLTNLFQETALNHVGMSDFVGDGMGATNAMIRHGLIWVVTRMHIQVDRYPIWGDVVEIDSWINGGSKNFIRRDFLVRDYATGEVLCRATSTWAMMNKDTRRLSRIPEDVQAEISPYYLKRCVIEDDSYEKIRKLDDDAPHIRPNIAPRLHDVDMNEHVNNVKYIGWVLESVPQTLLVASELASMVLEYRREVSASDVITSLTSPDMPDGDILDAVSGDITTSVMAGGVFHYTHLLKMQNNGREILRGKTTWRLKHTKWRKKDTTTKKCLTVSEANSEA